MAKNSMASWLLHNELSVRNKIHSRIKHMMEGVDMAIYDRSAGFSFVYHNFGDLLKKVQAVGAQSKPSLFHQAVVKKSPAIRKDSLAQLKENMDRLQDMHGRLQFMLNELEGLVRKT